MQLNSSQLDVIYLYYEGSTKTTNETLLPAFQQNNFNLTDTAVYVKASNRRSQRFPKRLDIVGVAHTGLQITLIDSNISDYSYFALMHTILPDCLMIKLLSISPSWLALGHIRHVRRSLFFIISSE